MYGIPWSFLLIGLLLCIRWYLRSQFGRIKSRRKLYGLTAIVTGANTGIGKETARGLAKRGAKVILACRDQQRGDDARRDIIESTGNKNVYVKTLNLASLESVRNFANDINETEDRLDILVNNAAAAGLPVSQSKTEDGLNTALQVNHYGPFLLTNMLLDLLKRSAPSRIVFVASVTHKIASVKPDNLHQEFEGFENYCVSKLYNVLTSNYLAENLKGTGVTSNCLHPGHVNTDVWENVPIKILKILIRAFLKFFQKSPSDAAETVLHAALSEQLDGVTGKYFVDCKESAVSEKARSVQFAETLWRHSEKAVGIQDKQYI